MCKIIDDRPLLVLPTLATKVGLNEAIFLQQLHYILKENDKVGKFVDGQKWYRDKPRDFSVKYFPFWDEGIIKRTIQNLRGDCLVLARSDLNKIPKDRSLWYSINYKAIDRLDKPVARLQKKKAKRAAARKVRTENEQSSQEDSKIEYTKVQNVLSTIGDEKESVKSTKHTNGKVQNVLLTSVQNVPIPIDLQLPINLLPKERGEKPPPPPAKNSSAKKVKNKKPLGAHIYKEMVGYFPDKSWYPNIDNDVGDDPEKIKFWRIVIFHYLGTYKNKFNVKAMLDFFNRGEIPGTKGQQNGRARNGTPNRKTTGTDTSQEIAELRRAAGLA